MNKRHLRIERIKDVEREYKAARAAMDLLAEHLHADRARSTVEGWSARDAENSSENLEATYLIRVYAEFESGLRDVWRTYFKKKKNTPMKHLLQLVAAQAIPQDKVEAADEVRDFRNSLVHEQTEGPVVILTLGEARSRLCSYFSFLPKDW